jgi:hypothetical protein
MAINIRKFLLVEDLKGLKRFKSFGIEVYSSSFNISTFEATPKSQKNAIATKTRRHQDSQSAYL